MSSLKRRKTKAPTTLEEVEKQLEWRTRYEEGYAILQCNADNTLHSVAYKLKINKNILKAFVYQNYPGYEPTPVFLKQKIAEIKANKKLKSKFDDAVQEVVKNKNISWIVIAKRLDVTVPTFTEYVNHVEPDIIPSKINFMLKTVQDQVEMILHDTEKKLKYEKLTKIYLSDPTVSLRRLASNNGIYQVAESTLKYFMHTTVPNCAQLREELVEKYNQNLITSDISKKREYLESRNATVQDKLQIILSDPQLKSEYDKAVEEYLVDPSWKVNRVVQSHNLQESVFKAYLSHTAQNRYEIKLKGKIDAKAIKIEESCESRVRQFENQGLCYDEFKKRVTCTNCNVILYSTDTQSLADHCEKHVQVDDIVPSPRQGSSEISEELDFGTWQTDELQDDPLDIKNEVQSEAPKDNVGPGENSWAAQTSQAAMPSTSRSKEMSPRPSTSATHTGGFLIKQDPGTPPPVQQQVMNPYIQEPPMVQSAPRLLPKPTAPPPQPQVMQQQPRLRIRQPQHHVPPQPAPPDPEPQQVCLRWNSFHNNMQTMFPTLLNKEKFVDVTLACEGQTVKCHKVVLSSCSAYIERLLTENPCKHPIILMPNTMRYWQIRALVDFMYRGEVNVEHEQLSSLLAAAEFLQVKGLAGPPTSPEQNTNIEDPEPEPPLSPRPKRKRVASPSPVPQHRQPVAAPPTPQPQQQQRTSLPNSPAVSITRLKQTPSAAQATPSTSRDTGSRAQSPGIEITPVVSFEEIKMEPIDISDSNDESMDPNMHCDVDYDMDNGDGDADKDYDDEDLDDDSGDVGRGEDDTGGREGDPGPSLQPSSDDQPGTSKTTSNGPDLTTPGFSGNGIEIDDSAASYCAADLGLTTEPPEDPPDSGPGNWKRLTKRWRCHYCPRKDDRKTTVRCIRCTNSICPNHRETMYQCGVCENKPIAETLDFPQETDSCHECPPGGNKVAARCITCFKSVCCMHRSELPHCVKCPALQQQGDEKSS